MDVEDDPDNYPDGDVSEVAAKRFHEDYLRLLGDDVQYVRLENMHYRDSRCDSLIEMTAAALNSDVVAMMLLAVQRGNLELSVKTALNRVYLHTGFKVDGFKVERVVRECLAPFPYIWFLREERLESLEFEELDVQMESSEEMSELSLGSLFEELLRSLKSLNHFTAHIMSLPIIQNLVHNGAGHHHLLLAAILILKHATVLRLSNSSESSLTCAERDFQEAHIDLKIQQCLKAISDSELSAQDFLVFIMATDIVPSQ